MLGVSRVEACCSIMYIKIRNEFEMMNVALVTLLAGIKEGLIEGLGDFLGSDVKIHFHFHRFAVDVF